MDKKDWFFEKRKTLLILGMIIILAALLTFLGVFLNRGFHGVSRLPHYDADRACFTENSFVAPVDKGLGIFDKNGNEHLIALEGNYRFTTSGKRIYVLTDQIIVYDEKGKELQRLATDDKFDYIRSSNGIITVLNDGKQVSYTEDLKPLTEYESPGVLMTLSAAEPSHSEMCYTAVKVTDNRYASDLFIVNKEGLVRHEEFIDQLICYVGYLNNDLIVATQNGLYVFENHVVKAHVGLNALRAVALTADRIAVLDQDQFLIYDKSLKKLDRQELSEQYNSLRTGYTKIMLVGEQGYARYHLGELKSYTTEKAIEGSGAIKDKLFIYNEQAVEEIQ